MFDKGRIRICSGCSAMGGADEVVNGANKRTVWQTAEISANREVMAWNVIEQ